MDDRSIAFDRTNLRASGSTLLLAGLVLLALLGTLSQYTAFVAVTRELGFQQFIDACVWDCRWYSDIITDGYGEADTPKVANRAFFPLYPSIIWAVHRLTAWDIDLCGYLCSTGFTIATAWAARAWFGPNLDAWRLFAFSLFLGPFSVLLTTLYTESLFILLSVLALNAINRQCWLEAGLWVALLSATRVTGVLMGAAIIARFVLAHLRTGGTLHSLLPAAVRTPGLIAALAVAPLGPLAYMAYLHVEAGDALTFIHVQSTWGRELQLPLSTLQTALGQLWSTDPARLTAVAAHWALLAGLALTLLLVLRGHIVEAVFCGCVLLISMSAGSGSMLRFVAGLVPFGMLACELLSRRRAVYLAAYPVAATLGFIAAISWFSRSTLLV